MWKKLLLTLVIGAGCGYFALKDVHWQSLIDNLRTAEWGYFALALVPMIISHILRTWRWQSVIKPLKSVGFMPIFSMNAVGFMMVNLLPLRLGELVRPFLLSQRETLPYTSALATCAVERVFDGLAVVAILIIGVGIAPLPVQEIPYLGWSVSWMVSSALIIFVPVLILLLALIFGKEWTLRLIDRALRTISPKFAEKVTGIIGNFVSGLSVLKGPKHLLLVLMQSLLIWICITLMTYCTLLAFHLDLPLYASFTVLGIICVGIMLPGPPGFAGNYELFCKAALGLFAIDANTAITFALASHAFNLLFMLVTGLACLPFTSLKGTGALLTKPPA